MATVQKRETDDSPAFFLSRPLKKSGDNNRVHRIKSTSFHWGSARFICRTSHRRIPHRQSVVVLGRLPYAPVNAQPTPAPAFTQQGQEPPARSSYPATSSVHPALPTPSLLAAPTARPPPRSHDPPPQRAFPVRLSHSQAPSCSHGCCPRLPRLSGSHSSSPSPPIPNGPFPKVPLY
ncbi:hypothetical protein BGZ61DRAFT_101682 [Ilyonectria robusta]|uniref:uncharacterized protein n=1 Tax=Ilyonectria robusta TaxID=1079257 RepID=UPI001E8EE86F|nr:uncharacterized protein BGZ61DRAFT_101682 [Ilyonectria robusta]KAH8672974.1 hypothetical protein BGZ61DRAFT_101682 [Ilyonectria robusta]